MIGYLGRYTHKVAISNHRLVSIDEGSVIFRYKDYRDGGKTMTLGAGEFLRRFCLHILTRGFRKIRHYGILSSRNKGKLCEQQSKMEIVHVPEESLSPYAKIMGKGYDAELCSCCKKGQMVVMSSFKARAPPGIFFLQSIIPNKY